MRAAATMRTNGLNVLRGSALALSMLLPLLATGTACAERTKAVATPHSARATAPRHAAQPDAAPTRVYMGWAVLSVPSWFEPVDGRYDLILHFHGGPQLQEENLEQARINAVVVSVNLGIGSGPYSDFYTGPKALQNTLDRTQKALDETGRAPGAHLGRLALTAWSAGFGAVGSILSEKQNIDRIDAVLLADGLHAAYLGYPGNYSIYTASLDKYASLARSAMRGEKLFALTHSSIPTDGYASSTETIGELLRMTSCAKTPRAAVGPGTMHEIYEVDRGSFHVKGFEGTREKDHIDHIKEMHETLLPYLKVRWER
jgi:hypothetical protein